MASMQVGPFPRFRFEDYLAKNARSNEKLEFLQGVVYAMAGGSREHSWLSVRIATALSAALSGRRCFVLNSDSMVVSPDREAGFYPDVSVFCGPELGRGAKPVENPILVVEVLSPSTRDYDLGAKLQQYKRIPSLRHILFVDSEAVAVQVYTRAEGELWPGNPATYQSREDVLGLSEMGVELGLREIYGDLDFAATAQ